MTLAFQLTRVRHLDVDALDLFDAIDREFPTGPQLGERPGPGHWLPLLGHVGGLRPLLDGRRACGRSWQVTCSPDRQGVVFEHFKKGAVYVVSAGLPY